MLYLFGNFYLLHFSYFHCIWKAEKENCCPLTSAFLECLHQSGLHRAAAGSRELSLGLLCAWVLLPPRAGVHRKSEWEAGKGTWAQVSKWVYWWGPSSSVCRGSSFRVYWLPGKDEHCPTLDLTPVKQGERPGLSLFADFHPVLSS